MEQFEVIVEPEAAGAPAKELHYAPRGLAFLICRRLSIYTIFGEQSESRPII